MPIGLSTEKGGGDSSPKLKRKSKSKKKILALLEAIWLPIEVAIIHGNVCQKGPRKEGNRNLAATRMAALEPAGSLQILVILQKPEMLESSLYTRIPKEQKGKMPNIRQMDNGSHQKRDPNYLLLSKDSWSPNSTRPPIWRQPKLLSYSGPDIPYFF